MSTNATPINTILSWFETGDFPNQEQFAASWTSFWHKDDFISMDKVENLNVKLQTKVDKEVYLSHIQNSDSHSQYLAKIDASNLTEEYINAWKQILNIVPVPHNVALIDDTENNIFGNVWSKGQSDEKYADKITSAVTFTDNNLSSAKQITYNQGKFYATDDNNNKKPILLQGDVVETQTSIRNPFVDADTMTIFYTGENGIEQRGVADLSPFKNSILNSSNLGYKGYLKISDTQPVGGWVVGLYKLIEFGSYTNLTPAVDQNGNSTTIVAADKKINEAIWNGTNWQPAQITLPVATPIDGFNSDSVVDPSSAKNAKTLFEIFKGGGIRDWVLGSYKAGEVVRYLGILWKAKIDITSAVPGNNSNWEVYTPFPNTQALFTSHSSTLTIDLVAQSITFTGSSTNKLSTNKGVFNITAQTISTPTSAAYFVVIYNTSTSVARAVATFNNSSIPLGVDDYVLFYVLNLTSVLQDVFGAKGYRLINTSGTTDYPIKPVAVSDVLYNKTFSTWQTSRTSDEKLWLCKAIVDAEFYNVKDNTVVTLYMLGKNVNPTNSYLGFIYAEAGKPALFLYADEFNNALSMPYDSVLHSGVKTYYLRNGARRESNTTIYGKVTIDWGQVPDGKRVAESTSGVTNNSNISRILYKKSDVFNNQLGFVKFARSRSFNDYFSAPTLESYAGSDGSGIPKAPYQDCREWALKWDEFVTNVPAGYSITKETITTEVPTDTNPEGKLPIYGYVFQPAKLVAGDATGNNAQTLPRIFINCSIHGFEKTPSFVVYEMLKQILTNWKSHSFLEYLRFNVEFCIIPFANPHGWNTGGGAGTRKNFNNVDLNRNFPAFWAGGGTSADSTYPGPSALSEIESQSIYTWMQGKITSNTVMGIDFHNFHGTPQTDPKLYNMAWVVNLGSELGQSSANVLMKELSVKYKAKSALIPQSDDYYIGQSNNYNGPGFSGSAMKSIGALYASTFEVCQNFRFNPNFKSHDSDAITFGVETFVNYLRVFLQENIEEYNRIK